MSNNVRDIVFKKAEEEATSILENAKREAEKIIEEAMKRKREIIEEEKNRIMKEVGIERRIAEARMRYRQIISLTKNSIVRDIEENVKKMLENMDKRKRFESLQILAIEGVNEVLSNLGTQIGRIVIYVSKRDRELSEKLVEVVRSKFRGIDVEVKEVDILGGVVIESPDRGIIIDNSYESRLKKALSSSLNELQRLFEV
ncbi:MAG: V-type ATP synthase subunit E family protein [Ignisphaera sp.]|uniref:V-ATPase subunit E n=1 Tax=Ignisphaera aggregans TaxID=334771 RepID=A0A7J3MZV4_9CREN